MPTVSSYAQQLTMINRLNANYSAMNKNIKHVATGQKVNSAADDASIYAIAQRMAKEVQSLDQATSNTQTAASMLNVADGAMTNTVDILRTLKEKAIAAANGTMKDSDRASMQKEFNQYLDQINDNAMVTYNGSYVVSGAYTGPTVETNQAYTNNSLGRDTTADTKLTDLTDRNGNNLNIAATDTVTVSYVKDGKTYSTSYSAADTSIQDIFKNANNAGGGEVFNVDNIGSTSYIGVDTSGKEKYTVDGENGITVSAAQSGKAGMISGFTVTVTDASGNEKKSVNSQLDSFSETIAATDKSDDTSLNMQIGTEAGQSMNVSIGDISARALGLQGSDGKFISIGTQKDAAAAINALDNAITRVLDQQTNVGAYTSRLEYTHKNLVTQGENVTAAKSTLIDADMAKEITQFTTNQMLVQATQAMLSQSYSNSSWFLSLLG